MSRAPFTFPSLGASTLSGRVSVLFLAGVLVTGLGFYGVLVSFTRGWLVDELDDRMHAVGVAASERLRVPLAFDDREGIAAALEDILHEGDVVGVAIYDRNSRPIMERVRSGEAWRAGVWRAPSDGAVESAGGALPTERQAGGGRATTREYVEPIASQAHDRAGDSNEASELFGLTEPTPLARGGAPRRTLGWLRVAVSTGRVDRLVGTAVRAGLCVLVLALALGVVATGMFRRFVVRPLDEAGRLARGIASGDLSQRLPVRSSDELGTLAESLNRMADGLDRAHKATELEAAHLRDSTRAVIDAAREARGVSEPARAFGIVAEQTRRLTGCSLVALAAPIEGSHELRVEFVDATDAGLAPGATLPAVELVAASNGAGGAQRLDTASDHELARALGAMGFASILVLAVPRPDASPDVLLLLGREEACFEPWQVDIVGALSSHLAGALQASKLRQRLEAAFAELERTRDSMVRAQNLRVAAEIASGAAHDFNNVLGAILGRAQLLRRRHDTGILQGPELVRALEVIEAAAKDGSDTVRRLREFGHVAPDSSMEVVDVGLALRDAVEFTRARWEAEAQAAGATIHVRVDADPGVHVLVRLSELRELFTNLLLNAVDALPRGGVIEATVRASEGRAHVVVADDGVGMTPEVQARIFEPFFTTKGAQGTGLGLSVVYGVVTRARGKVMVESAPGRGTRFLLNFPLANPAGGEAGEGDDATAASAAPFAGAPLDILVVDDEPAVREILVEILETLGHHPVGSASPVEIAATYELDSYDLVLTDIGMPDMNGWQLAQAIRGCDSNVMIVFVTGWGEELEAKVVREAGGDRVIAKPFTIEDLTSACDEAIRRRSRARAA